MSIEEGDMLLRLNRAHAAQEDMFGEIIITAATAARDD